MKNNIFSTIISQWENLSIKEKIDLLQKFEELNAIFEGREARELVLSKNSLSSNVLAYYSFEEPTIITIKEISHNPVQMADSIFHEGFHALCDDYFLDKADLKTFSAVDKSKLQKERSNMNLIYNRAYHEGVLTLFSLCYYEEQLVRKETCMYLIYNLLKCCENLNDCKMLLGILHNNVLGQYYSYKKYRDTLNFNLGSDYYASLLARVDEYDKKIFSDKLIKIKTNKEILIYPQEKIIVDNFEKGLKLLSDFQNGEIKQQEYLIEQLKNMSTTYLELK